MDGPCGLPFYLAFFSYRPLPEPPLEKRDPQAERREVEGYLDTLDSPWRKRVQDLVEDLPPMAETIRMAAFVPARFEQRRLPRFLSAFREEIRELVRQRGPVVELYILNNRFHDEAWDRTREVVAEWLETGGGLPVYLLEAVWQRGERGVLAKCRKLLADTILERARRRQRWEAPLYLLSEDADVERIEPGRTAYMIETLDRCPGLDALRGLQERTRAALAANHLLLLERRSWNLTELQLAAPRLRPGRREGANFYWNRVVTGGWNTCFTAHVYALIRGYTDSVDLFEDMDVGQKISVLRGAWDAGGRLLPNVGTVRQIPCRAESSALRAGLALAGRSHIYGHEHDPAGFYALEREPAFRDHDLAAMLAAIGEYARLRAANAWRFEEVLTELWRETLRILGERESALALFARTLHLLGFARHDYSLARDAIGLKDYRRFNGLAERFSAQAASAAGLRVSRTW